MIIDALEINQEREQSLNNLRVLFEVDGSETRGPTQSAQAELNTMLSAGAEFEPLTKISDNPDQAESISSKETSNDETNTDKK